MISEENDPLSLGGFGPHSNGKRDEDKTNEELLAELNYMRQIAKSNKSSRIMLDEMYQFVGLLDYKGNLLDVNEPALHGGGMIRSNIIGIPFWDCRWWAVNEKTRDDCRDACARAGRGEFIRYECDIFGKSAGTETITIDFSLMPLFDENGNVKLILPEGRNITEKKLAEDEIARKNNELRQLYEKIKELDQLKTEFFANVSHELRTPLTLITHPTEKLLRDPSISSESKKNLDVIARNTRTLLKHVNNLLDISKLEAGKMNVNYSLVDLTRDITLIGGCFEVLAKDKNIEYIIEHPQEKFMAAIDRDKIDRVVSNLLSNAFKYTPPGGRIELRLAKEEMYSGGPQGVTICVSDNGPGVPENQREAIFERFRQVDGSSTRKHGGTGLGLSIVKEFVQLHGGTVVVGQPKVGTGAVFTLHLPLTPNIQDMAHKTTVSDANVSEKMKQMEMDIKGGIVHMESKVNEPQLYIEHSEEDDSAFDAIHSMGSRMSLETIANQAVEELVDREVFNEESSSRQEKNRANGVILVVEDNVEMNRFIAELLSKTYVVHTAFNGRDGLAKVKSTMPDLILTDCMMPIMSGDEMVEAIRLTPEYDGIPIILLTAKADDNLRVKLLTNGVSDYVNKPFQTDELVARVQNLMAMKKAKQFIQEELSIANNDLGELVNQLAIKKRDLQVLVIELEKERKLLTQANRSKDEFLMNLSHELRTPLNGILGWSQLLKYDNTSSDDLRKGLESIEKCAYAQNSLVNDLLDMSLVISGKFILNLDDVDMSEVIRKAIEPLKTPTSNAKNANFILEVPDDIVPVLGDVIRLEQAIWNLVSNSLKFSNPNGTIRITLQVKPISSILECLEGGVCGQSNNQLHLLKQSIKKYQQLQANGSGEVTTNGDHAMSIDSGSTTTNGHQHNDVDENSIAEEEHNISDLAKSWCVINVFDNGCGITQDFLPHVFERFRQEDNSSTRGHGGLGLGLSIVNNIIELHNGFVFAHSQGEGTGSQFTIVLPSNTKSTKNLKRQRELGKITPNFPFSSAYRPLQGIKIMVIDDLLDTCELLANALEKLGAKPVTFQTASSAYEALITSSPLDRPAVIMSDITMPKEDGYSLLARIRARENQLNLPKIPSIALTASADKSRILESGYDCYLAKPVNFSDLLTSIQFVLNPTKPTPSHSQSSSSTITPLPSSSLQHQNLLIQQQINSQQQSIEILDERQLKRKK